MVISYMKRIYTSIDIGSDTIKMLVGEMYRGKLSVLAVSCVKSKGIKKGLIVDANETIVSLRQVIAEVEGKLGVKIDKVMANIPAYFTEYATVTGYSSINNEDKKVYSNDIVRTLQSCVYNKLKANQELVTIMPVDFSVDNKKGLKDPKGLVCNKLSAKAVLVTTTKKNVYSIISIMESLGIEVTDINIGPIADYYEFRNKEIDKAITAIVNIGAETTTVSVFDKGIILNSEIIPIGGKNIDNDISYVFKIDRDEANRLKETFALSNKQYAQVHEVYEVLNINKRELKINQYELSEVVMSRMMEILKLAKKQTSLLTNKEINYIIITGGMTEIPGMSTLVGELFGRETRLGNIETIGIRDNKYSTVSGMIKYFHDKLNLRGKEYSMFNKEKQEDLVSPKRKILNISNDSVLGKVFGYFFDN
jgi:cell division protein FtsA